MNYSFSEIQIVDSCCEHKTGVADMYFIIVSVYWPPSVMRLCVCACVCDIKSGHRQKIYLSVRPR